MYTKTETVLPVIKMLIYLRVTFFLVFRPELLQMITPNSCLLHWNQKLLPYIADKRR